MRLKYNQQDQSKNIRILLELIVYKKQKMLNRIPSSQTNEKKIQLRAPDRSLIKIFRQMYQKSLEQSWIKDQHAKLYSPIIYDHLARVSKNKKHSLHTLCCALQIYQHFCHLNQNDEKQLLSQPDQVIAEICLDISEHINQTKPDFTKNKNNLIKSDRMRCKLKILETLKWKINYVSFSNICQMFLGWLQLKMKIENQQYCFQQILEKEIQIMFEQFNFLHSSAFQSACKTINRVLKHFKLEVMGEMSSIFNGQAEIILLNQIKIQSINQLKYQNPIQLQKPKIGKSWAEILKMNFTPLQPINQYIFDSKLSSNLCKKNPKSNLAELRKKITQNKCQKSSLNFQPTPYFSFCQSKQNSHLFKTRSSNFQ